MQETKKTINKTARVPVVKVAKAGKAAVGHASGFMNFVRQQGIVGLAVGLAIGTQAAELVKVIVGSLITPLIDLLAGKGGLAGLKWTLTVGDRTAVFTFGGLIDAVLRFLAIAFVIYLVIHALKLDRLDKKKEG